MVEFQNNKFIDQTEVTVEQWAEFVLDGNEKFKPDSSIAKQFAYYELFYPSSKPDSLYKALGKISYYELPVIKEYFDTLNYNELRNILDFPVNGISFSDAQAYCVWRTTKYNAQNTSHTDERIVFNLPDSVVLKPLDSLHINNKNGRKIPIANYANSAYERDLDAQNKIIRKHISKQPVRAMSFPVDEHNVFDFYGNVAEMTANEGSAYGGSYFQQSTQLQNIPYVKPEPWLGFRCVGLIQN